MPSPSICLVPGCRFPSVLLVGLLVVHTSTAVHVSCAQRVSFSFFLCLACLWFRRGDQVEIVLGGMPTALRVAAAAVT